MVAAEVLCTVEAVAEAMKQKVAEAMEEAVAVVTVVVAILMQCSNESFDIRRCPTHTLLESLQSLF